MDKLYTVSSPRRIVGMDGIQGPLTTPTKMKFQDVLEMVRKGYEIYQVNPFNHSEKVRVTVSNINTIKFKTSRSAGTIQRKLNREIQEMGKPMMIDVIPKEKKETETPKVVKNKQNENKENIDAETILKPDDFKK